MYQITPALTIVYAINAKCWTAQAGEMLKSKNVIKHTVIKVQS